MMVFPKASFAKPTRLLPVSSLNIKIGQNNDGSDTYLKRGSWAYHHISTAANIAFALLWAAEGRTALQIVAYRMVETWQKINQPTQHQGKKLLSQPGAPMDLTGIRNCVDYFLRKCHQNFPVVEMGNPEYGEMAHARLEPSGEVIGTFVPESWGVIVLNREVRPPVIFSENPFSRCDARSPTFCSGRANGLLFKIPLLSSPKAPTKCHLIHGISILNTHHILENRLGPPQRTNRPRNRTKRHQQNHLLPRRCHRPRYVQPRHTLPGRQRRQRDVRRGQLHGGAIVPTC